MCTSLSYLWYQHLAWQQKTRKNRNRQRDSLKLVYSSQLNTIFHTTEGVDNPSKEEEYIPFLTVVSNNFEKDLPLVKNMLAASEKMTHAENGFKLSERAEMAAGWWFYDIFVTRDFLQKLFQQLLVPEGVHDRKTATIKIVDFFQGQLRKYGSEAKIKMHGDIPFAAPWWAWLMR
jgi:hypothetical protein